MTSRNPPHCNCPGTLGAGCGDPKCGSPSSMSLESICDELATMDGWRKELRHVHADGKKQYVWIKDNGEETFDHPYPATRDGAADALPDGWKWEKASSVWLSTWVTWIKGEPYIEVPDTGDEIFDRYLLAYKVRKAQT